MSTLLRILILTTIFFLTACAQRLVIGPSAYSALKRVSSVELRHILDKESLKEASYRQLAVLDTLLSSPDLSAKRRAYYNEMADMTILILSKINNPDFESFIAENFDFYRAGKAGSVLFTGYYTPLLHGSREKSETYLYPVYGIPDDLITVDLKKFGMSGRLRGTVREGELIPYFKREEIESKAGFDQRPILYVDDRVALFFLHIQGSGIVEMDDGSRIRLNYATVNGHAYRSIGKSLILDEEIPGELMSMEAIRDYFKQYPEKIDYYFHQNPSYVFFKEDSGGPYGSSAAVVTPFRSIAADSAYFPKFNLAYISTEIPDTKDASGNITTKPFSSLLYDQDSGGAIKGPRRIDIYFGEGDDAAFLAGHMKYKGSIYYLKKKEEK